MRRLWPTLGFALAAVEHLEPPSEEIWEERTSWFESQLYLYMGDGSHLVSEQASALMAEVQCCYCAGAWVAVVVLAFTVLDTQLLEVVIPDFKGYSKDRIDALGLGNEYQKLRLRRNRIVHLRENETAITVDQQWLNRRELQSEAEHAIKLMLSVFFSCPGT